jgi:MFS family permease
VPAEPLLTRAFVLTTVSSFGVFASIGMLLPVLPLFAKGPLGQGNVGVGLAVAAVAPTSLLLQPLGGRAGDRIGRRPLVVCGGAVMGASLLGYTLADSLGVLLALRLVTGAGEALVIVATATIVNDLAPDHRRGEAVSLYSLAVWGGLAAGPLLGEAILGDVHFDRVWVIAAGSALAAAAIGLLLPETRPPAATAAVHRGFLHRAARRPGLVLLVTATSFAGFSAFVALHARELGLGGAGPAFLLYAAVVLVIRSAGRRIPDRLGPVRAARSALVLLAAGLAIIGAVNSPAGLYAGTFVFALGQSLTFPALMTLAVSAAPVAERSAVIGSFSAFADLGFAAGAVSLGAVASVAGYRGVFLAGAGLALSGLALLRASRLRRPEREPPPPHRPLPQ